MGEQWETETLDLRSLRASDTIRENPSEEAGPGRPVREALRIPGAQPPGHFPGLTFMTVPFFTAQKGHEVQGNIAALFPRPPGNVLVEGPSL